MQVMTRQQAIEFLTTGTRTGRLATASPTGAPHVAPLWFLIDGDHAVFATGRDSLKGRHLQANPRAALTVDTNEYPYSYVTVRGPVHLTYDAPDLLAWNTRLAERYVPPGRAPEYGHRNTTPDMLLCRLHLERITGHADIAL